MSKQNITVKGTRIIAGEEAKRFVALCRSSEVPSPTRDLKKSSPAAEAHALVLRGQEARAPEPREERLLLAAALLIMTTYAGRFSLSEPRP